MAKTVPIKGPTAAATPQVSGCSHKGTNAATSHNPREINSAGTSAAICKVKSTSGNSSHKKSCECVSNINHSTKMPVSHAYLALLEISTCARARCRSKTVRSEERRVGKGGSCGARSEWYRSIEVY